MTAQTVRTSQPANVMRSARGVSRGNLETFVRVLLSCAQQLQERLTLTIPPRQQPCCLAAARNWSEIYCSCASPLISTRSAGANIPSRPSPRKRARVQPIPSRRSAHGTLECSLLLSIYPPSSAKTSPFTAPANIGDRQPPSGSSVLCSTMPITAG
jgi:hypothetical protein